MFRKLFYISFLLSPLSSLLSPLSFLLSPISAQSHDYKFRHLTTDQGLTSNNVYVVLKDADGFMWFTTNMGMCRYDGYTMKRFTSDPTDSTSLSGNFLYAEPLVDRSGNIWIGTFESGLSLFDRITGKFTHYKHDPRVNGSIDNNNIWSVYQDSDGVIWVGTYSALNKFDPVTGKFKFFRPSPDHEEDPVNRIYSMLEDSNRDLWIATGRGVFLYNRDTGVFRRFDPASPLTEKLNEQMVFHVMCDNDGDYWFAAEGGLFHYKIKNKELNLFSTQGTGGRTLSGTGVYHVLQDPLDAGIIWITSMWGLNRLNKETGTVEWILNDPDDPFSIGSNTINWTYIDETGKLWVATENAGVAVADLADMHSKDQFFFVPIHPAAPDTIGYSATTFLSDPSGDTWVGTAGGGLYRYDAHLALQSVFMGDQQDHDLLKNAYVFDLFIDSHSNFLIGTYGQGLYIFDTMDHLLTPCSFYPSDTSWMKTYIHDILEDKEGVLWVGTKSGLYYCTENIRTHHALALFDHTDLSVTEVMSFQADQSGRLWTGTAGKGLFCIPEEVNGKNTILHFEHDPEDPQSISSNVILCVYQDDKGILWIGTDRGLNRYTGSNEAFKTYLFPDDPAINFITALREDHNGHLWLETEAGLVRFDPEVPGKNYRIFTLRDGLPFDKYHPYSLHRSSDGKMLIGSTLEYGKGFFAFSPDSLPYNSHVPPVILTGFQVMNQPFELDSSISFKKHIVLHFNENFLSFEFSVLDYKDPPKNQYAYMLEGVDEDWIYCGNRRFANYTGLGPGHYTFRVKGSNNDGLWNEKGTYVNISIMPPFWKTPWVWVFYFAFGAALTYTWRRYDLKRQRLKQQLALERLESEKLKELDSLKSRFFANISHEFRTPLTLILGPLQKLFSNAPDEETRQDLSIMQRNARRLQNLINELLDLSKLESGKMELHTSTENIVELVKSYVQQFESLAKHKGITLEFRSERDDIPAWVDRDKIEKILYNLLGNAFKFTDMGGRIELAVSSWQLAEGAGNIANCQLSTANLPEQCIVITVSDTGAGIPPEKLPHIFDRFYQADDSYTTDSQGTGIGLALTKELVELHGGTITVESVVNRGSVFRVFLPVSNITSPPLPPLLKERGRRGQGVKGGEVQPTTDNQEPATWNVQPATRNAEPETRNPEPLILIVEDNADLRLYIRGILGQDYRMLEAGNGRQGLEKAIEHVPDLVLTDVMMPEMDGYELTRKLKSDERTSHIPVIILTARAGMESKIEGLETGADDFITKPFDPEELKVRIQNLILQRKKLKEKFLSELGMAFEEVAKPEKRENPVSMDQRFLLRARSVVENHLGDEAFDVECFSDEMHLSRTQMHRKLRALINQSATEFIRTVRLNRARMLLSNKTGNISEIALEVGFSNPAYFAECFRKQYGQTPSEYIHYQKQNSNH